MLKLKCYPKPTLKERVAKLDADLTALRNFFNSLNVKTNDKNKEVSRVEKPISPSKPKVSNGAVSYWRSFF